MFVSVLFLITSETGKNGSLFSENMKRTVGTKNLSYRPKYPSQSSEKLFLHEETLLNLQKMSN